MRFLMIANPPRNGRAAPPTAEQQAGLEKLVNNMVSAGQFVDTGAMQMPSSGTKLDYAGGKFTVTDGPFTESKELVAGYIIVNVDAKADAVELSRRFYELMGDGEGEILQLFGADEMAP
ncbi:MAG: YciI family protein [Tepidiformaceae bacterium]